MILMGIHTVSVNFFCETLQSLGVVYSVRTKKNALKITEIGDNGKKLFTKIPNPG